METSQIALQWAPIVALAVGGACAVFAVLAHSRGCPGARAVLRVAQLEKALAEFLLAGEAREQRVSEQANRMARSAAQMGRRRGARAQPAPDDEQTEGDAPAAPPAPGFDPFDQAMLSEFLRS